MGLLPEMGGVCGWVCARLLPAWGPGGRCRWLALTNCSWPSPGRAVGAHLEGDHRLAPCPSMPARCCSLGMSPCLGREGSPGNQPSPGGCGTGHQAVKPTVPFSHATLGCVGMWLEEVGLQQEPRSSARPRVCLCWPKSWQGRHRACLVTCVPLL